MRQRLFLRWALINVLLALGLIAGAARFGGQLSGATLVMIPLILAVFGFASAHAGRLFWRLENSSVARSRIRHEAEYLGFSAWTTQILGILSTIAGFWILLGGDHTQVAELGNRIQAGGGVALLGSFVGVLCSLVLTLGHRMLEHELGD